MMSKMTKHKSNSSEDTSPLFTCLLYKPVASHAPTSLMWSVFCGADCWTYLQIGTEDFPLETYQGTRWNYPFCFLHFHPWTSDWLQSVCVCVSNKVFELWKGVCVFLPDHLWQEREPLFPSLQSVVPYSTTSLSFTVTAATAAACNLRCDTYDMICGAHSLTQVELNIATAVLRKWPLRPCSNVMKQLHSHTRG